MTPPLVSVVIPAFNEEKRLPACVARIRAAFGAHPAVADSYELIVCDNNSTDRTAAIARDLLCRVVCEPVNQISRARNTGGRAASGEWLMFVDADSWPPPGLVGDVVPLLSDPRCIGGARLRAPAAEARGSPPPDVSHPPSASLPHVGTTRCGKESVVVGALRTDVDVLSRALDQRQKLRERVVQGRTVMGGHSVVNGDSDA